MSRQDRIVKAQATYQDVLDAPPHMVAEILGGTLSLQPRPAPRHAVAARFADRRDQRPVARDGHDGPGGWWIISEPELHLGSDVLVPDIAGWRRDRMPRLPDTAYFTTVPDWICEVLSPSTRAHDLGGKRMAYGAAGVGHLWLVDPIEKTLEAFRNTPEGWLLLTVLEDDDAASVPPFDAITFPLDALWPPEEPDDAA